MWLSQTHPYTQRRMCPRKAHSCGLKNSVLMFHGLLRRCLGHVRRHHHFKGAGGSSLARVCPHDTAAILGTTDY